MIRALYTSAVGMTTQMKRMDVLSNNIANVNTTGYKKDITVTSAFDDALAKRTHDLENKALLMNPARSIGDITYGVYVNEVYTDFSQGNIKTTHGTYDLAIGGSGFFVVSKPDANGNAMERYTRDGSFTVDAAGYLVTKDGGRVQGQNGDITLPNGTVTIEQNGEIYVDGELQATLKVTDFEDLKTLRKQEDNYLVRTNDTVDKAFAGQILQGSLETSNVNTVKEMVDLITVNRIYEANQKVITTLDQQLQRSAQEIGRK